MAKLFEVIDNKFNRENYPDLIGRRMFSPPSYAQVKMIESAELIGLGLSFCVKSIADFLTAEEAEELAKELLDAASANSEL